MTARCTALGLLLAALSACQLNPAAAAEEEREPAVAVLLVRPPRPMVALQGLAPAEPAPALLEPPDGSGLRPFPTLAAALAAAPDGAILRLEEGDYRERVVIARSVVILGRGAARTRLLAPDGDAPVIAVRGASAVRLHGFAVEGGAIGLSVEGGAGHRLENVSFSGMRESALVARMAGIVATGGEINDVGNGKTGRAIDVDGGSLELHRLKLRAAGRRAIQIRAAAGLLDGLDVEGSGLSALQAVDGADVRVVGGAYRDLGGAALYAGGARLAVDGAHISSSEFGVVGFRGANLVLARADVTGYGVSAIALVNGEGSVDHCALSKGGTEAAISVTGSKGGVVTLTDNRIRDPGPFGVHVTSASVVARGNTVTGARLDRERVMGDAFFAVDSNLRIEDNVLRGNAGSGVVAIRTTAKLNRNGLIDNGRSGLLLLDSSKVEASGNWFDRNAAAGIEVGEGARAKLERNRFGARGDYDIDVGCGRAAGFAEVAGGNTFASAPASRTCP